MPFAAAGQTGLALISLAFIIAGFASCGALWYTMVFRGSREERRQAEENRTDDHPSGAGGP